MNKSIQKKLMALVAVGVMALPMVNFAGEKPVLISEELVQISDTEDVVTSDNEKKINKYIGYTGTISEVIEGQHNISILVNPDTEEDEIGMIFHLPDNVSLWNQDTEEGVQAKDLKEGMTVEIFFHEHTPMTMSLPAQLTPSIVVIKGEEDSGSTFIGEFNRELVSTDNFLKLNIGEDTVIVDEKGEKLTEKDIAGNTALVFFGVSTRSIPAQTTPSKIVVLAGNIVEEEIEVELEVEIEKEEELVEVKEMIALRATALERGYKVLWNNEEKTVTLTKENQMIVVEVDSVDYTLNKSLGKFSKATELRNGNLYVSGSILELME